MGWSNFDTGSLITVDLTFTQELAFIEPLTRLLTRCYSLFISKYRLATGLDDGTSDNIADCRYFYFVKAATFFGVA